MSPKRVKELDLYLGVGRAARRRGEEPGRARQIKSAHGRPRFDLVREMRDAYNHRLRLVQHARQHGIKPAARAFATTVPTVRKWLRRFQQHGPSGLREHSRAHQHCPHKTPPEIEQQVLALRRKLPTFGAARLKREFDLTVSHMAIQRIWREHGLIRKRKKKYKRKQDLAAG